MSGLDRFNPSYAQEFPSSGIATSCIFSCPSDSFVLKMLYIIFLVHAPVVRMRRMSNIRQILSMVNLDLSRLIFAVIQGLESKPWSCFENLNNLMQACQSLAEARQPDFDSDGDHSNAYWAKKSSRAIANNRHRNLSTQHICFLLHDKRRARISAGGRS